MFVTLRERVWSSVFEHECFVQGLMVRNKIYHGVLEKKKILVEITNGHANKQNLGKSCVWVFVHIHLRFLYQPQSGEAQSC